MVYKQSIKLPNTTDKTDYCKSSTQEGTKTQLTESIALSHQNVLLKSPAPKAFLKATTKMSRALTVWFTFASELDNSPEVVQENVSGQVCWRVPPQGTPPEPPGLGGLDPERFLGEIARLLL